MQKIGFAEALESVITNDPRYHRDGYIFLRDALDFTTKQQKKIKGVSVRHVTGPELLDGVRQYALKEFGPMVMTVFDSWGIHSCEDIGHMVFNLIGAGVFGKTDEDSIQDFKNVYDFQQAFVQLPSSLHGQRPNCPRPDPPRRRSEFCQGELNENFALAVAHQLSDHRLLSFSNAHQFKCFSNASLPSIETCRIRFIVRHG